MVDILKANEKAHPYSEKVNNNDSENTHELPAEVQTVIKIDISKKFYSHTFRTWIEYQTVTIHSHTKIN